MELASIAFVTAILALQSSGVWPNGRNRNRDHTMHDIQYAMGPIPIPGHNQSSFVVDPTRQEVPVELPTIEPRVPDPPSLPWQSVGDDDLFAQGDRFIELNRPLIYIPKQEVDTEVPHVQRNPLYPDDLRAYDTVRARQQQVLADSNNRNYAFSGYHIPYLARNATHQEVSQLPTLAGRRASEYTSGAVEKNAVLANLKDPTATTVRRRADHILDDRSMYQVWDKNQHEELTDSIPQAALAQNAVINQPTEWMLTSKLRNTPRYLNAANNQHGYVRLQARQQRSEGTDYNTLKQKRLLLIGDQGFPSSQVTHLDGHSDGALQYAPTDRRREIMPSLQGPQLFQGGTGFSFRDQNTGNTQGRTGVTELETRDVIVPKMTPYTNTPIGTSYQFHTHHPFDMGTNRNPTVDFIKPYHPTKMYYPDSQPHFWADNTTIDIPLVR